MSYPEVIRYLESFINYERLPAWPYRESLKLERIKGFLEIINNPQDSLRCVHIAGSKGKGSTCAFIAYILRAAGFKVGLYTSPHLTDFRERIRILALKPSAFPSTSLGTGSLQPIKDFEGMISKEQLTELVERLKPVIEDYNKGSKYGPLSFFEVYTALAFVYFKEKKVDFAVLETGLGGRLDATNVVSPWVCAITPISYEHTQKLGKTLKKIAGEKTGIIKARSSKLEARSSIVISAPQEKEAFKVIKNRCKKVGAKLFVVGRDIVHEKIGARGSGLGAQRFRAKGILREYSDLKIRLLGKHQLVNATVAIGAIEALRNKGFDIGENSIKAGLCSAVWPGRCELISKKPLVVLDGAQNIASCLALKSAIKGNFKYKKLILVLGISCDKDIKGICGQLRDLADEVILTQARNPRAAKPRNLARYFKGLGVYVTKSVREAKVVSMQISGEEDLILVTGSLFVVGDFRDDN